MSNQVSPAVWTGLCDVQQTVAAGRQSGRQLKSVMAGGGWPVASAESDYSQCVVRQVALKPYGSGITQMPETALFMRTADSRLRQASPNALPDAVRCRWAQSREYFEMVENDTTSRVAEHEESECEPEERRDLPSAE